MIRLEALKDTIESGDQNYPIYVALMPAEVIARIAQVPNYHESTGNADIARNVSNVPVKEWQRPRIPGKIEAIRQLFDNTGEFMPNPILLGENLHASDPPEVRPYVKAGHATPVWELWIDDAPSGSEKPLWILDGQHRIAGLSESAQSSNPVPVVFLLNQGSSHYGADTLAKIFAQVTTSATPLGSLHREWLSYAFKLNEYARTEPRSTEQKRSMAAVIDLCMTPSFGEQANPFFDRIQFNDGPPLLKIQPGGHFYSCIELKEIVFRSYYSAQKNQPELTPDELAKEMCLARTALESVMTTPVERSVFFGRESHHHKIMEDAFWSGILSHLCAHHPPQSWKDLLRKLRFDTTNWDFSWKIGLHGRDQSRSKKLATKVMQQIFWERQLPKGSSNIADFLRGNGAQFELEAFKLTPTGRRSQLQTQSLQVRKGDTVTFPIGQRAGIRLLNSSPNIQEIQVTDKKAPPGTLVAYKKVLQTSGLILDESLHKNPLELLFTLIHYGGVTSTADVDVGWQP